MKQLTLEILPWEFSVCQVENYSEVNLQADFTFTSKTDAECSLVCLTEQVPAHTLNREDGWVALRVVGVLDFSLIGILADISGRLAQEKISIFALSTFNTDYILLKNEKLEHAVQMLKPQYAITPALPDVRKNYC